MNGWPDDFYRRLFGSIEAPFVYSDLLAPLGARDYENSFIRDVDERHADRLAIKREARRGRIEAAVIRRINARAGHVDRFVPGRPYRPPHCAPQTAVEGSP